MDDLREQFSGIYDQYIEKIYRFVYLKVNSQEIAEDLTSKVFANGWKSYNKAISDPGAFLYRIARNTVIDYYRQKGRAKVISTDAAAEIADPRNKPQEMAILNADINAVKNALQGIKKDYQDVIIWHYLDDLSVPEIATLTGKQEGAVRVMLHRGLNALKNVINLQS